jgi:hypothetical protein
MITEYLFTNSELIDEYLSQLGIGDTRSLAKIQSKVSLSITGPRLESIRDHVNEPLPLHKKITHLTKALTKAGLLGRTRPTVMLQSDNPEPRFVLETTAARKVIFAPEHFAKIPKLKEFAVWVADPDPADLTPEATWKYTGTFLLLTQLQFDDVRFQTVFSGCSALQAVVNGFRGDRLILGPDGEPLGRGSYVHPVEKLRQMSVAVSEPREIQALYRLRYMTNEQCYTYDGREYRVNDLLAYPLFIAAA